MPGWVQFGGEYVFFEGGRVSYQLDDVATEPTRTNTIDAESRTVIVAAEDRTVTA